MRIVNSVPLATPTALPPATPLDPATALPYAHVHDLGNPTQNIHILYQEAADPFNPATGVEIEVYTYLTNTSAPCMVAKYTFDMDRRSDVPMPTNTLGARWIYVRQVPPTAPGANDPVLYQIAYESQNTNAYTNFRGN
jgi:hypothetical protein